MLYVDKRIGSGELAQYLKDLHLPINDEHEYQFGDFHFLGRGDGGEPTPVGIERKALSDFISSMRTKRLPTIQLPGLVQNFTGNVWIVIEGLWSVDYHGGFLTVREGKQWVPLEVAKQQVPYSEFEGMILTLEMRGGVRTRLTTSKHMTAKFIKTLYHWWTVKDADQHTSHLGFHNPVADRAILIPPTLCREWAARLPGIAWTKSGEVARHFGSAYNMALAAETEWTKIKGIGKLMADRAVTKIREYTP